MERAVPAYSSLICLKKFVLDMREELFGQDPAGALRRAAVTRMLAIFIEGVAVVERDFLARRDVTQGDDPDATAAPLGLAVGRATVVEESGRVAGGIAVQVVLVVEAKYEPVALFTEPQGFGLGDAPSGVFHDGSAAKQGGFGKAAEAVDGGRPDAESGRAGAGRGFHAGRWRAAGKGARGVHAGLNGEMESTR